MYIYMNIHIHIHQYLVAERWFKIIMFTFKPGSATHLLCVLGQLTYPLQPGISILSSDKSTYKIPSRSNIL